MHISRRKYIKRCNSDYVGATLAVAQKCEPMPPNPQKCRGVLHTPYICTVFFEGANSELGSGFEAGINANIPIQNMPFEFSIGANAVYRKPDNKEYMDENEQNVRSELTEYVFSVPVMLQYNINYKERTFYLQAGAQIDFPLKTEQKIAIGEEVTWHECPWRNSYDWGLVLGLGWRINENFALDGRMIVGISEFNKDLGGYKLVQGNIGLSYFF